MDARGPNRQALVIGFWLPVLAWMGFIFYVSSLPGSDIPPLFPFQDIIFHFSAYCLLAFLFNRALKNTYKDMAPLQLIFSTILFVFFYGITDELHQAFVPGRQASGFDLFINGLGSVAGSFIYR